MDVNARFIQSWPIFLQLALSNFHCHPKFHAVICMCDLEIPIAWGQFQSIFQHAPMSYPLILFSDCKIVMHQGPFLFLQAIWHVDQAWRVESRY